MSSILLSVMVPTTPDREGDFNLLWNELNRQAKGLPVELFYDDEGKHLSIGAKRDRMYKKAKGLFSVQWDSDDFIHDKGLELIVDAIRENQDVDCITYREMCKINGVQQLSCFSLEYDDWHDSPTWPEGFAYARTPFFKTPIKTELCKRIGVQDMRYGEDHDFARRIKPLLKTQTHIPKFIYHYIHYSTNHVERYGFDR